MQCKRSASWEHLIGATTRPASAAVKEEGTHGTSQVFADMSWRSAGGWEAEVCEFCRKDESHRWALWKVPWVDKVHQLEGLHRSAQIPVSQAFLCLCAGDRALSFFLLAVCTFREVKWKKADDYLTAWLNRITFRSPLHVCPLWWLFATKRLKSLARIRIPNSSTQPFIQKWVVNWEYYFDEQWRATDVWTSLPCCITPSVDNELE